MTQTYASERVARDLRTRLVAKISAQDHAYIQQVTPAKLLTNLTSDVDAIKMFVVAGDRVDHLLGVPDHRRQRAAAVDRLEAGARRAGDAADHRRDLLRSCSGRCASCSRKAQEAIDWLNKVINESILGSALIRLLNSQQYEYEKFLAANTEARDISLSILRLFASLIPVIMFSTNLATLTILMLGGRFVIQGSMTLGDFTAFNSYLSILIFPVIMIGFMSNVMAQASASYQRIAKVLDAPDRRPAAPSSADLRGDIAVRNVVVTLGGKTVLKDVSFAAPAGTRTAVIGPTAAGKTQLLYLLTGLLKPESGHGRVRRPEHRRLRPGDAAPAGRLRLPGQHHLQSDAAREHRLQQDRDRRGLWRRRSRPPS